MPKLLKKATLSPDARASAPSLLAKNASVHSSISAVVAFLPIKSIAVKLIIIDPAVGLFGSKFRIMSVIFTPLIETLIFAAAHAIRNDTASLTAASVSGTVFGS